MDLGEDVVESKIKVSILCLTYNHEKYIRKCLEGFVSQKTNFEYEVLIHDDASTDKTAEIIREYELKYPHLIKPIYQKENQYSQGVKISKTFQYPRAQGEYLAWCEGDDCWTDEFKLQKQVDFLDRNRDYSVCAHRVCMNNLKTGLKTNIPKISEDRDYSAEEIIKGGALFQLSSLVFRKELHDKKPSCFDAKGFGDIQIYIYGAICGKFRVLKDVMSIYNHGTEGSWTIRVGKNKKKNILNQKEQIKMFEKVNIFYNFRYDDAIQYAVRRLEFNLAILNEDKIELKKPQYKHFFKQYKKARIKGFLKKHFSWLLKIKR